jgi:NAD(P)-dependent dehydrogenase (short-subunit alcohol dehydrogenase family)
MIDLANKTCIVTGAFGALGTAVAQGLIDAGAKVALLDRVAQPPHDLAAKLGPNAHLFGGVDLTEPAAAKQAVDAAAAQLGGLYALVNVAGAFRWETLNDGDIATWDLLYNVNLRTVAIAAKAALPHLLAAKTGRIVNIGAGAAASRAAAGMGAYTASKAGVAKLTEALSEEVKGQGITANAILPSTIDTAANRRDMPAADFSKWVEPSAIADVIVFLLSDKARAITGASIPVFGLV